MAMVASLAGPSSAEEEPTTLTSPRVGAGWLHSCYLSTYGTPTCWGNNDDLQATEPSIAFKALSVGYHHNCGLKTDGSVRCWGNDIHGQTEPSPGPFTALTSGNDFSCGLRGDDTVVCWGLGADEYWDDPEIMPDGEFTAIDAGNGHVCGVRDDDTVTCWGRNDHGQATVPPDTLFTAVSAGNYHTCGLKTDQSIDCWGQNEDGKLNHPVTGTFSAVVASGRHSCALTTDDKVDCWGENNSGQSVDPPGDFTSISSSGLHNCGIKTDGTIYCWGNNGDGQSSPPNFAEPGGPHDRTIKLASAATATGVVKPVDGWSGCVNTVPVRVQRKKPIRNHRGDIVGYNWVNVAYDLTNKAGKFDAANQSKKGKYRAAAPKRIFTVDGVSHTCRAAISKTVTLD